jgi:hypothetical protein
VSISPTFYEQHQRFRYVLLQLKKIGGETVGEIDSRHHVAIIKTVSLVSFLVKPNFQQMTRRIINDF